MKKFVPFVLALMAISVSISAQSGAVNTLTAKEKSEGWMLLFDGATLNNLCRKARRSGTLWMGPGPRQRRLARLQG